MISFSNINKQYGKQLVFASRVSRLANGENTEYPGDWARPVAESAAAPLILTRMTPPSWTLSGVFAQPFFGSYSAQSTDGQTLSAKRDDADHLMLHGQLFLVDVRTHAVRQLTTDGGSYFNPDWSPDGTAIRVDADGPPVPLRVLDGLGTAELNRALA